VAGRYEVPYAAYRLVRILGRFELPDPAWKGWVFHSGKLWTPEGHGFLPVDGGWWGLLVRKAAMFSQMYDRQRQFDVLMLRAGRSDLADGIDPVGRSGPTGLSEPNNEVGRTAQPAGLDLFHKHITTRTEIETGTLKVKMESK
jgi:hypothetical protein